MFRELVCRKRWRSLFAMACVAACALAPAWVLSAEQVTLRLPGGQPMLCDVLKITKSDVKVRGDGDKELTLPFGLLAPAEVSACYKQAPEPKTASLHFEMGIYFLKKELLDDAKMALSEAAKKDENLKPRVAELLKAMQPPTASKPKTDKPEKATPVTASDANESKNAHAAGESNEVMKDNDFQKRFLHREVPARTETQMKEFLAARLDELNSVVGGKWRLIETKHYYCFANIPETKHTFVANQWNEPLYEMLCKILRHKEGEKLWNNKMPVYYFETFRQFQRFAVEIDKSPGAAYSGGYFAAQGRDVHICIPFMTERLKGNVNRADEMARSTICHEGTHAFLQLTGEDVTLPKWLHEGMAQFMEFLFDTEKNPDKRETVGRLKNVINANRGNPPSWDETHDRPMGGTDLEGYCCAYGKLEFLYRNFDHQCLPQMVRMIKSGKSEAEAMESVFKMKLEKLEAGYRNWIREAVKINFNFPAPN